MNTKEPPRLPPRLPPVVKPPPPPPATVDIRFINGIDGMTPEEVKALVGQGGRFVIFQYCISVLVLSFKRSSGIYFLRPTETGFQKSLGCSLVSLVAGWWGIPWGPIWSIATLATNLGGGKNVTREVMWAMGLPMPAPVTVQDLSPVERADHEERRRRRSITIAAVWVLVAAVVLGMGWIVYKVATLKPYPVQPALAPGEREFRSADELVLFGNGHAFGNTEAATGLAQRLNEKMMRWIDPDEGEPVPESLGIDQTRVYCHRSSYQCVFLVSVPQLDTLDRDGRMALGLKAWSDALIVLRESGVDSAVLRVAVALRDSDSYHRTMTAVLPPFWEERLAMKPEVGTGAGSERILFSWFDPKGATFLPAPSGAVR